MMISCKQTMVSLAIGIGIISSGCSQRMNAIAPSSPIEPRAASAFTIAQSPPSRDPEIIYLPTPPEVVDRMLAIAEVDDNDILYDLGSGDGRIAIAAVRDYGVRRAVGIDIDPQQIQAANANARRVGVSDRVRFLNQDLFQSDFSEATVVTLYLLPTLNLQLRPQLFEQLEPGTRVVSHAFDMGEWKPERTEQIEVDGQTHTIYLWTIPPNPPADLQQ